MNYRLDKYGNKLSVLGFGCMRFPMKAGRIDMEETEREKLRDAQRELEGPVYRGLRKLLNKFAKF